VQKFARRSTQGSIRDPNAAVYRVLQTTVMSEPCKVHGNSLLLCVRTCFNIYLGSENAANQSAAKVMSPKPPICSQPVV
jgi:hypothetical protein